MRFRVCLFAALALAASSAEAQVPRVRMAVGAGFGSYGWYGGGPYGYGYAPYGNFGGYGFSPYGPYGGFGAYNGYGTIGGYVGDGSYGAMNYAQQLYQQQSSLTQQVFQQEQQLLVDQIDEAKTRLGRLDELKQQKFQEYLNMDGSGQAAVRLQMMNDYLALDSSMRERWKGDTVAQIVIGRDLARLDELLNYRALNADDQAQFRAAMLERYRGLPPAEQQVWQNDPIVRSVLGNNW